jgi:FMN phosphatase YigB (HAD superfamily)
VPSGRRTGEGADDPRLTFLLDVDNTLLDNDAAKAQLAVGLVALLGDDGAARFWRLYEDVRRDEGMVNIPLTLARFERAAGLGTDAAPAAGPDRARRFALADLLMAFPYERYLYPGALEAVAHLRRLGRVAILSDGDPTFQPSKIWRAGLDAAVDGYVLVFDHKEDHLAEVVAAFPADHYVLVDDKPDILARVRERLACPLTTVLVRQGKYAAAGGAAGEAAVHLAIDRIADLRSLDTADFLRGADV